MNGRPAFPESSLLRELRDLITALCDGELTPPQVARLEEMIVDDPACATYYLAAMEVHATLPQLDAAGAALHLPKSFADQHLLPSDRCNPSCGLPLLPEADPDAATSSVALPQQQIGSQPFGSHGRTRSFWSTVQSPVALATCAALVVGSVLGWWLRSRDLPVASTPSATDIRVTPVAFLEADNGCSWGTDSVQLHGVGSAVSSGDDITLYEGTADFRLSSGVSLSVEGPASFVIASPKAVALQHGRMTVYVPDGVQDFRMLAGMCRIAARRGEMGVYIAGNRTEVHAFWGEVVVSSSAFHETFDSDTAAAATLREEKDLPVGEMLTRAVVGPRRALSLTGDSDSARIAGWSGSRSYEFAPKLSMGGELRISRKYIESVTASKPVGYWRFEELDGAMAKNEISDGIGLHVKGNVRLGGVAQNRVLDFAQMDSTGYLISDETLQSLGGGDYSVEIWMKPSHFHRGGLVSLMENPEVERGKHGLLLETHAATTSPAQRTPKRLRFLHRDPPMNGYETGTSCTSSSHYRVRRWQHIVATKKGSQMRLYINGQLSGTAKDRTSLETNLFLVLRWTAAVKDDRYFFGELDELAVYDRALEKEEIETHYSSVRWSTKAATTTSRASTKSRAPQRDSSS